MTKFNVGDVVRVVSKGEDCEKLVGLMFEVADAHGRSVTLDVTAACKQVKGFSGWSLKGDKRGWFVENELLELVVSAGVQKKAPKVKAKRSSPVSKSGLTPQCRKLIDLLEAKGSVTALEAGGVYRIRALPRRIADLKEAGYSIVSTLSYDVTGQRYARYCLKGQVDQSVAA